MEEQIATASSAEFQGDCSVDLCPRTGDGMTDEIRDATKHVNFADLICNDCNGSGSCLFLLFTMCNQVMKNDGIVFMMTCVFWCAWCLSIDFDVRPALLKFLQIFANGFRPGWQKTGAKQTTSVRNFTTGECFGQRNIRRLLCSVIPNSARA